MADVLLAWSFPCFKAYVHIQNSVNFQKRIVVLMNILVEQIFAVISNKEKEWAPLENPLYEVVCFTLATQLRSPMTFDT